MTAPGTSGVRARLEDERQRIAAERLEAISYATLCIECEAKRERRRGASPGDDRGPSSTAAV